MTADEQRLLNAYRFMDDHRKNHLMEMAEDLSAAAFIHAGDRKEEAQKKRNSWSVIQGGK